MLGCQRRCFLGELLIAHHHAASAVVVQCTGNNLLNRCNPNPLAITLALDRDALRASLGNQIGMDRLAASASCSPNALAISLRCVVGRT